MVYERSGMTGRDVQNSPRPQLAGVREIGGVSTLRSDCDVPSLFQSMTLEREKSVRDASTETSKDEGRPNGNDSSTHARLVAENSILAKRLSEAQVQCMHGGGDGEWGACILTLKCMLALEDSSRMRYR